MTETVTFDATDDAVVQCPYPHYRAMRDDAPVLELDGAAFGRPGERIFAISRHADVKRILHEPATFSSRFGSPAAKPSPELLARLKEVIAEGWPNVPTMLTEDPPVAHPVPPPGLEGVHAQAGQSAGTGDPGDLRGPRRPASTGRRGSTSSTSSPCRVPVRAVAVILEVPETRQADFKRWADSSVAAIGRTISDDERVAAELDIVEQQQYFASELEARRTDPSRRLPDRSPQRRADTRRRRQGRPARHGRDALDHPPDPGRRQRDHRQPARGSDGAARRTSRRMGATEGRPVTGVVGRRGGAAVGEPEPGPVPDRHDRHRDRRHPDPGRLDAVGDVRLGRPRRPALRVDPRSSARIAPG